MNIYGSSVDFNEDPKRMVSIDPKKSDVEVSKEIIFCKTKDGEIIAQTKDVKLNQVNLKKADLKEVVELFNETITKNPNNLKNLQTNARTLKSKVNSYNKKIDDHFFSRLLYNLGFIKKLEIKEFDILTKSGSIEDLQKIQAIEIMENILGKRLDVEIPKEIKSKSRFDSWKTNKDIINFKYLVLRHLINKETNTLRKESLPRDLLLDDYLDLDSIKNGNIYNLNDILKGYISFDLKIKDVVERYQDFKFQFSKQPKDKSQLKDFHLLDAQILKKDKEIQEMNDRIMELESKSQIKLDINSKNAYVSDLNILKFKLALMEQYKDSTLDDPETFKQDFVDDAINVISKGVVEEISMPYYNSVILPTVPVSVEVSIPEMKNFFKSDSGEIIITINKNDNKKV